MARGRRSVALQVLSHVVALFRAVFFFPFFSFLRSVTCFVSQLLSSGSPFLPPHTPLQPASASISHFVLRSAFNEQSTAHASVVSLMWSVQNETAGE